MGEELRVMRFADMLEHADRDDPVIGVRLHPVVEQLELDPVGQAFGLGPLARDRELLVG